MMEYGVFLIAMAALIYGADFIIKESERIALHYNISHFIIGATLVAFGTSLPEMASTMTAASFKKSDMAVANVLGSVIFNTTLVLGLVFLLSKKMHPKRDLFALDSAWVVAPVLLFLLVIYDGVVSRFDGFLLLLLMLSYLYFLFHSSKESLQIELDVDEKERFLWGKTLLLLLLGFTLTLGGAHYVVQSATEIAHSLEVSEWLIGLFLIAFGTSLPELVVSVVAAKKGNAEMSIGNIIGSNVANFSMVLGGSALLYPLSIDMAKSGFDVAVLVASALMLLFILANRLYNAAGGIFLLSILLLFMQNAII